MAAPSVYVSTDYSDFLINALDNGFENVRARQTVNFEGKARASVVNEGSDPEER